MKKTREKAKKDRAQKGVGGGRSGLFSCEGCLGGLGLAVVLSDGLRRPELDNQGWGRNSGKGWGERGKDEEGEAP